MVRRGRIIAVFLVMVLGFALVGGRLVYLQVFKARELSARAERQQQRLLKLEPKRGTIYDRKGRELAVSLHVDSVYGIPAAVENPRSLAQRLGSILREDPAYIEKRLSSDRRFVWLSRKIDPERAEKVKALGAKEVGLILETRRFYPKKSLAGQVIGFAGVDNEGLEGVELAYDRELRGIGGWVLAERDAFGRTVFPAGPGYQYRQPKPGNDIVLTIDEVIQHIAEKELDRALTNSRAKGGVCIVMNPQTGEILAMAVRSSTNRPFNPNSPGNYRPSEWRNRAVTDAFEPGSIFKPILAAAALEERIIHPLERFDCSAGRIRVADRVINDAKKHGVLTFTDVIAESSNVGIIKAAQAVGKERFFKYITAFGFGRKTDIDLPGEIQGIVRDYRLWSGVSLASMAIGQEIAVTPIQISAAYAAIANGGVLMKPYIVSEVISREMGEGKRFKPTAVGRPISPETSEKLSRILEKVVEKGTGRKAKPAGYTAAGKTGTAQKVDAKTGTYSKNEHVSSFVGFVPAKNPNLVIFVMIDTPSGPNIFGGSVAAPVFKAVAEQSLNYLGIPPDDAGERMLLVSK